MKKYLIIAAAAAVALASCAKVETYKISENDGEMPIAFSNYAPKSLTKADGSYVASTTLVNNKKFGVYSYATANGTAFATSSAGALGTRFMDDVAVTYTTGGDSDATKNTYSPLRYWPSGDTPDWLTFWAYYPVQADNGISYTEPDGSNDLGVFAFTAAATPAAMVDFMVADVVNDKIYGEAAGDHIAVNGIVPLTFKHQLTKIAIKIKTDNEDELTNVVLTDVKVYNVKTKGNLEAEYATGTTTTTWADQAIEGTPKVYDVTKNGADFSNEVLTTTAVGGADADLFLMVPQTMVVPTFSTTPNIPANLSNTPQYILVEWDVKAYDTAAHATANGAEGLLSTTHNTQAIYLDNVVVKNSSDAVVSNDWAKNQFTTYTITVGPKPIRFTAVAVAWDDETFGNVTVR